MNKVYVTQIFNVSVNSLFMYFNIERSKSISKGFAIRSHQNAEYNLALSNLILP